MLLDMLQHRFIERKDIMDLKIKTPKYIQIAIKRILYHSKVYENNAKLVDEWIKNNNIDRKTPLMNFIEKSPKKKMSRIEGQLNIFDYLN